MQDAYLEVARRAPEYLAHATMPPFRWLRLRTGQTLQALHRHHLKVHFVTTGRRELTILRTDPDLDPLRSRPDFQALMLDLAFPAESFARPR